MDLDTLLRHFFGTDELDTLEDSALEAGREQLLLAFWMEGEPSRRFALWALLHSLGDAPDPVTAFDGTREREAALSYARAAARLERS